MNSLRIKRVSHKFGTVDLVIVLIRNLVMALDREY